MNRKYGEILLCYKHIIFYDVTEMHPPSYSLQWHTDQEVDYGILTVKLNTFVNIPKLIKSAFVIAIMNTIMKNFL